MLLCLIRSPILNTQFSCDRKIAIFKPSEIRLFFLLKLSHEIIPLFFIKRSCQARINMLKWIYSNKRLKSLKMLLKVSSCVFPEHCRHINSSKRLLRIVLCTPFIVLQFPISSVVDIAAFIWVWRFALKFWKTELIFRYLIPL